MKKTSNNNNKSEKELSRNKFIPNLSLFITFLENLIKNPKSKNKKSKQPITRKTEKGPPRNRLSLPNRAPATLAPLAAIAQNFLFRSASTKMARLEKTLTHCLLFKRSHLYRHKKKNSHLYKKWAKSTPKTTTFSKFNNSMKKMNSTSPLTSIKLSETTSLKIISKIYSKTLKKNEKLTLQKLNTFFFFVKSFLL